MTILLDRNTRFITCGFTGKQGTFHSLQSKDYGGEFVGGVNPGKGGTIHEGYPVFNTAFEAKRKTQATAALVFVPARHAVDSIIECIESEFELIICSTNGIPIQDMIKIKAYIDRSNSILVGPNSFGVISPGDSKMGIMPGHIYMPGKVGVVSRSATLSYDIVQMLTAEDIGQSTCIGIGADPISGSSFIDMLKLFDKDTDTDAVLLIGEIGGVSEVDAARWIRDNMQKPVVIFMAGYHAPKGKRLGHAGAVINVKEESVEEKTKLIEDCGVHVVKSIFDIPSALKLVIKSDS